MKNQRGFTITEVLIGAVIGLVGMFLILRTQEDFDRNKRSLSSGGEAQVGGTVATFQLERDIRNGGMGFGGSVHLGCDVAAKDTGTAFNFPFAPVRIINGGGGAADEIHVLYGVSNAPSSTYNVQSTSADDTLLDTRGGLELNDLAIMASDSGCRMVHLSAVNVAGGAAVAPQVLHASGFGRYSGSTAVTIPFQATNAFFYNMGKSPRLDAWTINKNRLVMSNRIENHDADLDTWGDVVDGIADLQAQYGLDTDNDGTVETWTATDPANALAWAQLRMIRFAVLIRGQERAKSPVTTTAPTWAGGAFVMRNVDESADSGPGSAPVNNWRYYRYQVMESVVPLRNMIWRNAW